MFDTAELNALFGCNHTCIIKLGTKGDSRFEHVQFKNKIFHAICGHSHDGSLNMRYFDDVPLEILPHVPALIQTNSMTAMIKCLPNHYRTTLN